MNLGMKESSVNTLFQLLRSALGNQSAEGLPADIDWKEVIDLSFEQGVAAIAVDGLGFAHDNDDDNLNLNRLPAWKRGG